MPGSALAARLEPGGGRVSAARPTLPDDDALAALYRRVVAGLGGLGFDWYEVSNFARPGYRCRHNSAVWRGRDYRAWGPERWAPWACAGSATCPTSRPIWPRSKGAPSRRAATSS